MEFADAWILAGIPLVLAALWYRLRGGRSREAKVPFPRARVFASLPRGIRARLVWVPDVLRASILVLVLVALARPQTADVEELTGLGVDVMIALDMSGSMNAVDKTDAEIQAYHADDKEPPNRFEVAKNTIERFVKNRKEDRVGLVLFGRDVFLKFPLTLDYARVLQDLDSLVLDNGIRKGKGDGCSNECTIDGSATALGDALARSYARLKGSKGASKIIVLITDGKNNMSKLDPKTVAKYIANQAEQVKIFTILVGSNDTTKVPVLEPFTGDVARDVYGHIIYGDPSQPFPTDEPLLKEIAALTGGKYYHSYDEEKFKEAFADLEKTEFKVEKQVFRHDLFHIPLILALLLVALELLGRIFVMRKVPS